ncbi:MAG: NAD(P)/FAD-dependent oxidoreductase [Chloroflexi bacterium]|nr:NAD(P)/FAD-dependent oxidoreductase [Chloroflexota bacterium]
MAAGRAAEMGAEVILLEKMEREGKKVLISGNTRCNLTNSRSLDDFILMYGKNGRFLHSAFRHFFSADLIELLGKHGIRTSAEQDGRVFPASGKSDDVVNALTSYMRENGVITITRSPVLNIELAGQGMMAVYTQDRTFRTGAVVMATGGASYPQTGSNGEGYRMAERLGHTIVKLRPSLVPLEVREKDQVRNLQGISLKDIRITSFACSADDIRPHLVPPVDTGRGIHGKRARTPVIESRTGALVFTHYGISGPAILLMSLAVADAMEKGPVSLTIDMVPGKDHRQLKEELRDEFSRHGTRYCHTILENMVPSRVAASLLKAAGTAADKTANQVTAVERENIVSRLKDFKFNVSRTRPLAEAMVTAGGVRIEEVNPRTMESKLINGLYLCGELLDIDADTGGFNLQAAFSTGYLAGESAARSK